MRLTLFTIEPTFDSFFFGVGCGSARRASSFFGVGVAVGEGEGEGVGDGVAAATFAGPAVLRERPIRKAPPAIKMTSRNAATRPIVRRLIVKPACELFSCTSKRLTSGFAVAPGRGAGGRDLA